MAQRLIAGLPPDLILSAGYRLIFAAVDPTTGADVSGVTVSDVSFFVRDLHGNAGDDDTGPLLVPSHEA